MSATLLDERQYRKLLDVTLPVAIRTEEEYHRLLGAAAALMDKPDDEMSEEEGRLLERLSILIDEYETWAHPASDGYTAQDAGVSAQIEEHETERRLDRAAQEPYIGNPERQAQH